MFSVFVEEQRLTLLDLLNLFPSCTPPLDHLLSALSPLPPRMYSVASSPLVSPTRVAVAFTVVAFECKATSDVSVVPLRLVLNVSHLAHGPQSDAWVGTP
jgi:sulfite reductase alpha subunit-like flavoprotein